MQLSQRERAAVIASLERIDEERQRILDILLPEPGDQEEPDPCAHPDEALVDQSTLGDERYACTACGAEFSQHPRFLNPEE